jgi:hypothetical protein
MEMKRNNQCPIQLFSFGASLSRMGEGETLRSGEAAPTATLQDAVRVHSIQLSHFYTIFYTSSSKLVSQLAGSL